MGNALQLAKGGSASLKTMPIAEGRKLRLPWSAGAQKPAASGDPLTQRVEDNAFHLAAVGDTRLQQSVSGNSRPVAPVLA